MVKAPRPAGGDPIRRDTIAYSVGVGVACIGLMLMLFAGGLMLKNERKVKPKPQVVPYGCYVWSDGLEQCKRGHNGAA